MVSPVLACGDRLGDVHISGRHRGQLGAVESIVLH